MACVIRYDYPVQAQLQIFLIYTVNNVKMEDEIQQK